MYNCPKRMLKRESGRERERAKERERGRGTGSKRDHGAQWRPFTAGQNATLK